MAEHDERSKRPKDCLRSERSRVDLSTVSIPVIGAKAPEREHDMVTWRNLQCSGDPAARWDMSNLENLQRIVHHGGRTTLYLDGSGWNDPSKTRPLSISDPSAAFFNTVLERVQLTFDVPMERAERRVLNEEAGGILSSFSSANEVKFREPLRLGYTLYPAAEPNQGYIIHEVRVFFEKPATPDNRARFAELRLPMSFVAQYSKDR
jgi:hypothetical protein